MTLTAGEPDRSSADVSPRTEWLDIGPEPIGLPAAAGAAVSGRRGLAVFLPIVVVLAALWWYARPDSGADAAADPIVMATTIAPLPSPSVTPLSSQTIPDRGPRGSLDRPIRSIVYSPDAVFATQPLAANVDQLVRSTDGLSWDPVRLDPADGSARFVDLAIHPDAPEVLRALRFDDESTIGEYRSVDGVNWSLWGPTVQTGPSVDHVVGAIGDGMWGVITQQQTIVPMTEVSAALFAVLGDDPTLVESISGDAVDPAIANDVCRIERLFGGPNEFELIDCAGDVLAAVRVGPEQRRTMDVAQLILQSQFVLSTAVSTDETAEILFDGGTIFQSMVATGDRLLIVTMDVLFALDEADDFAQAIPFSVHEWSSESGLRTLDLPDGMGRWRGNRPLELSVASGRVMLTGPDSTYIRSTDEAPEWDVFAPPVPRPDLLQSSRDSRAAFATAGRSSTVWLSRDLTRWAELKLADGIVVDVLTADDDGIVVVTADGVTMAVPIDWSQAVVP